MDLSRSLPSAAEAHSDDSSSEDLDQCSDGQTFDHQPWAKFADAPGGDNSSNNDNQPEGQELMGEDETPFYESPNRQWQEPQVEQLITYAGNVRNYLMEGMGQESRDRDLSAMLENLPQSDTMAPSSERLQQVCDMGYLLAEPPVSTDWPAGRHEIGKGPPANNKHPQPYQPLPDGQFVRLLELFPGSGASVQCQFHIVALEKAEGRYEALSYTWDTEWAPGWTHQVDESPYVQCNGAAMPVKPNLFDALVMLRYHDRPRLIWADALCINQGDLLERSSQVALMSAIFRSAFRVLIWLGMSERDKRVNAPDSITSETSYRAFDGICAVVGAWMQYKRLEAELRFASRSDGHEEPPPPPSLSSSSSVWHDVLKLYSCRFFSRLWVIQEVLLAQRANVLWGGCMISWELIGLAASILRSNFSRLNLSSPRVYMDNYVPRNVPTGVLNACFMYRLSESQGYSNPLKYSTHQLLSLTRQFNCLEPRDRIYGLLGLGTTDGIAQQIIPDYEKSPAEVYIQITRKIIENSRSLNILSSVQRKSKNGSMYHYSNPRGSGFDWQAPSWVPQWNFVLSRTLVPLDPADSFNASKRMPAQLQLGEDQRRLIVRGLIIGKATDVSWPGFRSFWRGEQPGRIGSWGRPSNPKAEQSATSNENRSRLESLLQSGKWSLRELEELAMTLSGGKNWYGLPVADPITHLADFAKCLLKAGLLWSLDKPHDQPRNVSSITAQDRPVLGPGLAKANEAQDETVQCTSRDHSRADPDQIAARHIDLSTLESLAVHGNADRFLDAATTTCERRARFMIDQSDGGTCIGPEAMSEGDLVCVLFGADMPFVVRPQGAAYLVMGEAYVYGLMQGQAIESMTSGSECWIELV